MEIDLLEPVQLGKSTQWIRIRAANARYPQFNRRRGVL